MKKILILLFAALCLSVPKLSAQLGFDFGMDFILMNREAPSGYKAGAFGMGPYAGIIYGIPVSMSDMINIGVNYKYDLITGAPGAWDDEKKLCPMTLMNRDSDIREQHIQVPVTFNHGGGIFNLAVGPVFDYCLKSSTSYDNGKTWAFDNIKDLKMKPFNVYLKAGAGVGLKGFSFNLTANYGLLDLSPDNSSLRRWGVGLDFHLIF